MDDDDGEKEMGPECEAESLFLANLSCLSSLAGERGRADPGTVLLMSLGGRRSSVSSGKSLQDTDFGMALPSEPSACVFVRVCVCVFCCNVMFL